MAKQETKILGIDFNAPVILGLTLISFVVLIMSEVFGINVKDTLAVYYTSWKDPFMYMRLFTHVMVHADFAHFTGNFMLILAVGAMVEEKYGSSRLFIMVAVTAFVTGLINVIFFKNVMLMGASGIVFMLILIASFVNIRGGHIPLTVLLVAALYIGNEVVSGLFSADNISQMSHIIGGICGGVFGFVLRVKDKS